MSDYINREEFIKLEQARYCRDCERRKGMKCGEKVFCYDIGDAPCRACGVDDMLDDLEDYPAADVQEVRRGKWLPCTAPGDVGYPAYCLWKCSLCDDGVAYRTRYCQSCGADMRGQK